MKNIYQTKKGQSSSLTRGFKDPSKNRLQNYHLIAYNGFKSHEIYTGYGAAKEYCGVRVSKYPQRLQYKVGSRY